MLSVKQSVCFLLKRAKYCEKGDFFIENRYCQKRVYHCSRPSELYRTEFKPTYWALLSCCGAIKVSIWWLYKSELPTTSAGFQVSLILSFSMVILVIIMGLRIGVNFNAVIKTGILTH